MAEYSVEVDHAGSATLYLDSLPLLVNVEKGGAYDALLTMVQAGISKGATDQQKQDAARAITQIRTLGKPLTVGEFRKARRGVPIRQVLRVRRNARSVGLMSP